MDWRERRFCHAARDRQPFGSRFQKAPRAGLYRLHVAGATLPVPFVISDSPEVTLSSHAGRSKQEALPSRSP